MENKIIEYKKALDIQEVYTNTKKLGKLIFTCECGNNITINGANSHSKICEYSNTSKMKFIKNKFSGYSNCIYCNSFIKYEPNKKRLDRCLLTFCSINCKNATSYFLRHIKKCDVCQSPTIKKRTCSKECHYKLISNTVKNWVSENRESDLYLNRNKKISEASKTAFKGRIPWNKGIKLK